MELEPTLSSSLEVEEYLRCSESSISGQDAITLFPVTLFCWEKVCSSVYKVQYLRKMFMVFVKELNWPIALTTINFPFGLGGTIAEYMKGKRGGLFIKLDQLIPSEH